MSKQKQQIPIYLRNGLDAWFELVNNFWWNGHIYEEQELWNAQWNDVPTSAKNFNERLVRYISAGISDGGEEGYRFLSVCVPWREEELLRTGKGLTSKKAKELSGKVAEWYYDITKEYYWKHDGHYRTPAVRKATPESLVPKNKQVLENIPLLIPFLNLRHRKINEEQLKDVAFNAGRSAFIQNTANNLIRRVPEIENTLSQYGISAYPSRLIWIRRTDLELHQRDKAYDAERKEINDYFVLNYSLVETYKIENRTDEVQSRIRNLNEQMNTLATRWWTNYRSSIKNK